MLLTNSFYGKSTNYSIVILLLIVICTFLLYSNTLNHKFLNWDDDKQITENPFTKTLDKSTFKNLYLFDKHTSLTLLTHSLTYKFWKLNPFVYHLTNVLIHILNVILVFILVLQISKNKTVTYISTVLFAWHPLRVESVAWISERKDLLFVFFSLLAIIFYLKYIKGRLSTKMYLAVLIFTWFASLSKIQAVVLPLLLLMIDIYYNRKINLLSILEKLILFYIIFIFKVQYIDLEMIHILRLLFFFTTIGIVHYLENQKIKSYFLFLFSILFIFFGVKTKLLYIYIPITLWFIYENYTESLLSFKKLILQYKKHIAITLIGISILFTCYYLLFYNPITFWLNSSTIDNKFSFINRIFLGGYSLFIYLLKYFFPFNLNAINPYPVTYNGWLPIEYYIYTFLSILIISLIIYKLIRIKKGIKEYIFWLLFFFINISLVLHIIPIEGRLVVADRYTYFAYLGLFVLTGYLFVFLKNNKFFKPFIIYLYVIIGIGLAYLTYERNKIWKDNYTLYNDVIKNNPDNYFAQWNLGNAFLEANKYRESITLYEKALELNPKEYDKSTILSNRGMAKLNLSDTLGAIKDFQHSISLNNINQSSLNNLGWTYFCMKQYKDAYFELSRSIAADSTFFLAWINRGILQNELMNYEKAIQDFNKALKLNPDYYFAYNNIGWAKFNLQQYNDAISYYSAALKIKPDFELGLYNRALAKLYMHDFYSATNDFISSINLNPKRVYNYYYCGWAYYNLNQIKLACEYWGYSLKMGCIDAKKPIETYCK